MGKTSIEWTDASWNPITGCTEISPGCANCYAARLAATRLSHLPEYKGLAKIDTEIPKHKQSRRTRWTGEVRFHLERLNEPLRWKKPRKIFVCDMGDLFHRDVPSWQIARVFGIIARCPQHIFQILTKRADRMKQFFEVAMLDIGEAVKTHPQLTQMQLRIGRGVTCNWPLPNVWLGVSVENQTMADQRIPLLLETPAAVRWISAEPLLGPVDLTQISFGHVWKNGERQPSRHNLLAPITIFGSEGDYVLPGLDWVVCGGESGVNARPMHPDWARSLRDQCAASGVPFFFKQWGAWRHNDGFYIAGNVHAEKWRVGKKKSGRLLDGREWNEFPNEINEGKKAIVRLEGTMLKGEI